MVVKKGSAPARGTSTPKTPTKTKGPHVNEMSDTDNEEPSISLEDHTTSAEPDAAAFDVQGVLAKAKAYKEAGRAILADLDAAIAVKVSELQELQRLRSDFLGENQHTAAPQARARRSELALGLPYVVGERAKRGGSTERVLTVLKENAPAGMGRAAVLKRLGIQDDKAESAKISQALMQLKKKGTIAYDESLRLYSAKPE